MVVEKYRNSRAAAHDRLYRRLRTRRFSLGVREIGLWKRYGRGVVQQTGWRGRSAQRSIPPGDEGCGADAQGTYKNRRETADTSPARSANRPLLWPALLALHQSYETSSWHGRLCRPWQEATQPFGMVTSPGPSSDQHGRQPMPVDYRRDLSLDSHQMSASSTAR